MKRKQYTMDYKRKAVARVANGEGIEQVAKELKLSTSSLLHKWRARLDMAKEVSVMKPVISTRERDAIIYLKHAKVAMTEELRSGKSKDLSRSNLLALLALETLMNQE